MSQFPGGGPDYDIEGIVEMLMGLLDRVDGIEKRLKLIEALKGLQQYEPDPK
jgi:hypothetical protein